MKRDKQTNTHRDTHIDYSTIRADSMKTPIPNSKSLMGCYRSPTGDFPLLVLFLSPINCLHPVLANFMWPQSGH